MTYALVVPPELLAELVAIRAATGMSIRRQLLIAAWLWIRASRPSCQPGHGLITDKEVTA